MKNSILVISTFLTLHLNLGFAITQMTVVDNYELATQKESWQGIRNHQLPSEILNQVEIAIPEFAFAAPFSQLFFQHRSFYVCYRDCNRNPLLDLVYDQEGYRIPIDFAEFQRRNNERHLANIYQTNVYYWLAKFFDNLEQEYNITLIKRLKVVVDRQVGDPVFGHPQHNNAFYSPDDHSLNFLPENNSRRNRRSMGARLRPTALDPSVIIHEAGHAVFQTLFGTYINSEIGGLNEGFSDYLAMISLNDHRIGAIMTSGNSIRDLNDLRKYTPKAPVHSLGMVYASLLWQIRSIFDETQYKTLNQIFFETIKRMSQKIVPTALSFPSIYLETLKELMPEISSIKVLAIEKAFNLVFDYQIDLKDSLKLIEGPINSSGFKKVRFETHFSENARRDYSLPEKKEALLTLIETRDNKENLDGSIWYLVGVEKENMVTPVWILYYKNLDVILEVRDMTGQPFSNSNKDLSEAVSVIGENLSQLLDWSKNNGQEVASIILSNNNGLGSYLRARRNIITENTSVIFNNKILEAKIHRVTLRKALLPRIIGLFSPEIRNMLKMFTHINYFTIAKPEDNQNKLIEILPGRLMIGYELITSGNAKIKIIMESIDER